VRCVVVIAALVLATGAAYAGDLCRPGAVRHGATVDLDVKDADVHDVMRLLADVGGINIVVADTVQAKVTLRLKHVPWDRAACTIAAVHHLRVTVKDNIVLVMPRGK
jgi:type II secretory pathway component HofQ